MTANPFDQIQQAEHDVLKAEQDQYIGGYSLSRGATNIELLQGPLAKPICERLVALQYLPQESIDNNLDEAREAILHKQSHVFIHQFESAVQLMQREAGLKSDAWLSTKTYDALHNVFSFEDPTDLDHWIQPQFNRFLDRAIYARLNVLGFVPQPATRFFTVSASQGNQRASQYAEMHFAVEKCLAYFNQVTQYLGLQTPPYQNHRFALTSLLFDTDGLSKQLTHNRQNIIGLLKPVVRPAPWKKPKNGYPTLDKNKLPALSLRFLMAHARIEVWLNGYGSQIEGNTINSVLKPTDNISTLSYSRSLVPGLGSSSSRRNIKIGKELERKVHFWEDAKRLINQHQSQSQSQSQQSIGTAIRKLKTEIRNKDLTFASVALRTIGYADALNKIEINQEDMDVSTLNEEVSKLDEEAIKSKAWQHDHSSSLFDGIKRAWRWVVKKAKAVVGFFVDKLRLIIRAVKSVAIQGFSWFRKLGAVFASAAKHVTQKTWYASDTLFITRDKDFDMVTALSSEASNTELQQALNKVARQTQNFQAAVAISKLIVLAINNIKNILINPLLGSIRTMMMLVNFNNLFTPQDKAYIENAFAALPS